MKFVTVCYISQLNNVLNLQLDICYSFQFSNYFVVFPYSILLFFVYGYDKVYVVDSVSNVRVREEWNSCELVEYVVNFSSAGYALRYCFEVLPCSFINFASKALPNSLELPLQHVINLFLLSISHLHSHIPSSELRIVCHILIFYDFVLLQLCILLFYL